MKYVAAATAVTVMFGLSVPAIPVWFAGGAVIAVWCHYIQHLMLGVTSGVDFLSLVLAYGLLGVFFPFTICNVLFGKVKR